MPGGHSPSPMRRPRRAPLSSPPCPQGRPAVRDRQEMEGELIVRSSRLLSWAGAEYTTEGLADMHSALGRPSE